MKITLKIVGVCLLVFVSVGAFANKENEPFIIETSPMIAFTNARVIDGTGQAAKEGQTVLINQGRIVDIGPAKSVNIPQQAKRIDLKNKSLLPGWVMHHEHLYHHSDHHAPDPLIITQQPITFPKLYLAAGVTSARTAGSIEPYTDLRIKESIAAGTLIGPDFDLTAPYLEGKPGAVLQLHTLNDAEEAREHVRYWAGQGFTSFKAYTYITPAQLAAAIDEVHKHGLKITGHLCSVTFREAADMGIDQLEHGFFTFTDFQAGKKPGKCHAEAQTSGVLSLNTEDKEVQSLFRHLIKKKVTVTSTLAALARPFGLLPPLPDDEIALMDKESADHYRQELLNARQAQSQMLEMQQAVKKTMALEAAFWRAGGRLVVGTDPVPPGSLAGYDSLSSIELLADAGIPPLNVIQIATQNGAQAMGVADDRGTIAIGKRADLIVVDGNPAEDIKAIRNIDSVFKNGIGYDPLAIKNSVISSIGGPG